MTMGQRSQSVTRLILAGTLYCLAVTGCLSPITLNRAVTSYDQAITDAISKQLLINIARAHQHQPIHFTGVSNIAATFTLRIGEENEMSIRLSEAIRRSRRDRAA